MKKFGTLVMALTLMGCGEGKLGEASESYCQSLCDWAVECAESEREVDSTTLMADCVAAAEAINPECADYADLDVASSTALNECNEAIDEAQAAGDCDPFTGNIVDQTASIPPGDCASQGSSAQETFNEVQDSTSEPGDELCDRLAESICSTLSECVLGDYADSIDSVNEALGFGSVQEYCMSVDSIDSFVAECKADGQYQSGDSVTDVNTEREAARECVVDLADAECSEIYSGQLPAVCAGAFASPEQLAGIGTGLADLVQSYAQ